MNIFKRIIVGGTGVENQNNGIHMSQTVNIIIMFIFLIFRF